MRDRIYSASFLSLSIFLAACGGGGNGGGTPPPPPQPDFAISLSANSVNVSQGSASSPITVSITPQNGFSASVQVSFTGVPSGVTTNPATPFSVSPGQSASVLFGAASSATTGQFNITADGTSGSLSHTQSLALAIQAATQANLPQTAYAQNDSAPSLDNPPGAPRTRHIVYDSANQRFYVANAAMNRVEVFAASSATLQSTIDAPGASSVDLSSDGTTLWVGTNTEQILALSTSSLQVTSRYPVAGLTPVPGTVFIRPTEVLALSSGQALVRIRQAAAGESLLALWNPTTNSFTNLTSLAPAVFQSGVGVLARSGDHAHVLATANDTSGQIALFDTNGNLLVGPQAPVAGTISLAAANSNGSRYAIAVTSNGASQVLLLDSKLNTLAGYPTVGASGLVFSSDGQSLYITEPYGNASALSTLSTTNLQRTGQVPDIAIQGVATQIEEVGPAPFVYGLNNRGVAYLDVSQPSSLASAAPVFSTAPVSQPSQGPSAGGTSLTMSGASFFSDPQLRFGANNPVNATAASNSQLQAVSPPSVASGPVNLTAYFTNNWLALAPAAFSYGPQIVRILPNAGSASGGDTVTVYGYGFGNSTNGLTVTIAGQPATIVSVDALPTVATALGLDNTFPFPLERIVLTTPPGSAGKADLSVTCATGSIATAKAFQYLTSSKTYTNADLYKFILYDQSRQQLDLSATDHLDVFDLTKQTFVSTIEPPNGPSIFTALRGLSLTPDNAQLVLADFGAQSVYLINPDGPADNGTSVNVGGVAGYAASGPSRVAATSAQTVFVSLSGEGSSTGSCSNCLGQMNLLASPPSFQPAPQPEVTALTGAPLLQTNSAGDTAYLGYSSSPGGPVGFWNSSSPDVFSVSTAQNLATDLTTSGDGTLFALRAQNTTEIRQQDLTLAATPAQPEIETVPNRVAVPGVAMHPSGALIYEPFLDGPPLAAPPATGIHGGIDIRDAHNGQLRLRVYLPEPFAMLSTDVDGLHGQFLTTDENGQRLFALTTSGLTIVQLSYAPLGIGTLNPANGTAAGGVSVTLRGSGFRNGVTATLGGKSATVTFTNMNTLTLTTPATATGPQQLVLTNPDGESVSLDAAFEAQ
jgi:hypothetical protein